MAPLTKRQEDIERALEESGGIITQAAEKLGVNRTYLSRLVSQSEGLQEVVRAAKSKLVDLAEKGLLEKVEEGTSGHAYSFYPRSGNQGVTPVEWSWRGALNRQARWICICLTMVAISQMTARVVKPNPGPQEQAFACPADILIYGGQAGGGKSFFLVTEPLRHIANGKFRGAIFRRTYPQLKGQGGVWEEACELYPAFGARMREGQDLDARFPSGAEIAFCHLQHEKTKYEYQGHAIAYLAFDELTHFTETQFFYLLSRNRSTSGVRPYIRASCNPDAGSWVAEFIAWWIDQDSGLPDPDRAGVLRYFVREHGDQGEQLFWSSTRKELLQQFPDYKPHEVLSVTFIPASLDDNPKLIEKDPGYRARLKAQPRIERERLEKGNWKVSEGAQIPSEWVKRYAILPDGVVQFVYHGQLHEVSQSRFRRIATVDTAGTSREKAAEERGDPPSYSVCAVWDALDNYRFFVDKQPHLLKQLLFLRFVWRAQVDWGELKAKVPEVLEAWDVPKVYIENAHYGQPLAKEIKCCSKELIPTKIGGMDDGSRGAKLERAIASGMLSRWEHGQIFVPEEPTDWLSKYLREVTVWTGKPKETADQIDVTSHACYVTRRGSGGGWGGAISIKDPGNGREAIFRRSAGRESDRPGHNRWNLGSR